MSRRLGDVLIATGKINEAQLHRALTAQLVLGGHLGTSLLEMGLLDEESLGEALARMSGVPYADFDTLSRIPYAVVRSLPARLVQKHKVIPLRLDGRILHLAMIDPRNILAIDEISFVTGYRIVPWVSPEVRILQALEKYYDVARSPRFVTLAQELSALSSPRERLRPQGGDTVALAGQAEPAPPAPRQAAMAAQAGSATQAMPAPAAGFAHHSTMTDPWEGYDDGRNWREVAAALDAEDMEDHPADMRREEADTRPHPASALPGDAVTLMASALRLSEAQSVDDVIDAALAYAAARLPRTLVLVARGHHAVAWSGRGWGPDEAAWRRLELPLHGEGPAIFSLVPEGITHFIGPVAGQPWASAFYESLGAEPPRTALLIPIRLKSRTAAWLYGDGGSADILAIDLPSLVSLCGRAAFALQIMILRNKILSA
jgi:hypothetical protein